MAFHRGMTVRVNGKIQRQAVLTSYMRDDADVVEQEAQRYVNDNREQGIDRAREARIERYALQVELTGQVEFEQSTMFQATFPSLPILEEVDNGIDYSAAIDTICGILNNPAECR